MIPLMVVGNLDGNTAPEAQDKVVPLVTANCCLVLDLEKCKYISSAGLRTLLMIAKQLAAQDGQCALAGVCDEVKDVMEMTGFSGFFKTYDTVAAASKALK